MSIHIMALVWERAPYEGGTLLVLLALADWANEEGVTWPSMAQLAGKSRMQVRNVRYILRKLEEAEMIHREQPGPQAARRRSIASISRPYRRSHSPGNAPMRTTQIRQGNKTYRPLTMYPGKICMRHPIAALGGTPLPPCQAAIAALGGTPLPPWGGTPLPPTHHRSVREPSEDPPTPAELGESTLRSGGRWGTKTLDPTGAGHQPSRHGLQPPCHWHESQDGCQTGPQGRHRGLCLLRPPRPAGAARRARSPDALALPARPGRHRGVRRATGLALRHRPCRRSRPGAMSGDAWTYRPFADPVPLPCQGCGVADATVAVWHGWVWQVSLCAACADAHRAVHGEQLELFGEGDTP